MESFKASVDVEKNQLVEIRKETEDDHKRTKNPSLNSCVKILTSVGWRAAIGRKSEEEEISFIKGWIIAFNKRDLQGGNIFGFIRFKDVKDGGKLLVELINIKLDGAKLGVNIARFNKEGNRIDGSSIPVHRVSVNSHRNAHTHKVSYKDALTSQIHSRSCTLPPLEPEISKWWKGYSLVGITKDLESLDGIKESLENFGWFGGTVRYVGGLTVLISFSSYCEAKKFLDDNKVALLERWFSFIDLLNGNDLSYDRVASCCIYGMPLSLWDSRFFRITWERYGHVLLQPITSVEYCNLSYVQILILTCSLGRIRDRLEVAWKDRTFPIAICEEEEDRAPSFIVQNQ
ncbi:hypothetical protein E3N88_26642 [Mikania micrantha]|uniref:RRM domain-containing protein n=1 Tax=Mikania micrantha TaxID=192012 RepID=A0A5N6MV32_9ASTR|nr:hypothetical protein E3N88_26642 [Mikania micrantha]